MDLQSISAYLNNTKRRRRANAAGGGLVAAQLVGATHFSKTRLAAHDVWLGAPAQVTALYTNHDTWNNFRAHVDYWNSAYAGDARPRVLPLPLNCSESTQASVAAGDHDADFAYFFTQHLAAYPASGRILVCPGWEFNYSWAWSGDTAKFIAIWQRVVAIGRSISSRFAFGWVPGMAPGGVEAKGSYWPGDGWVDFLGFTCYCKKANGYTSGPGKNDATFEWGTARSQTNGIDWLLAFKDLPVLVMEHGCDYDDPAYPALVAATVPTERLLGALLFDNNEDPSLDTQVHDYSLPDLGNAYVAAHGVPKYGANALSETHPEWSPWANNDCSFVSGEIRSTGNEYGGRGFYADPSPVTPGAYRFEVLVEQVAPNDSYFINLNTNAAAAQDANIIKETGNAPFAAVNVGAGFTGLSTAVLQDGKTLITANIVIAAHSAFYTFIGPKSTTAGRAIKCHGLSLRRVL